MISVEKFFVHDPVAQLVRATVPKPCSDIPFHYVRELLWGMEYAVLFLGVPFGALVWVFVGLRPTLFFGRAREGFFLFLLPGWGSVLFSFVGEVVVFLF